MNIKIKKNIIILLRYNFDKFFKYFIFLNNSNKLFIYILFTFIFNDIKLSTLLIIILNSKLS